jgi:cephalosporin hydroxylase
MRETPISITASIDTFGTKSGYTQHHQTVPMWKSAPDLARYRHIIEATRPEVVVETGTKWGGTAAWLADTFGVDVITVDVASEATALAGWPRITTITGSSSIAPDVVALVTELVASRRYMMSLDSDHHFGHVQAEIRAYAPLVSVGCYLVVEDALGDLVQPEEARRFGARIPEEGGALPAIEAELFDRPEWVRDLDVEGMDPVSHSPFGWWRRA